MQPFAWMVVSALGLPGCSLLGGSACSTDVQRETTSPGHVYVATVFHRECGATVGFNTQVSLRRSSAPFDPKQGQVFAIAGRHVLPVAWTTDDHLRIGLPADRVYKEQAQWEAVKIEYTRQP